MRYGTYLDGMIAVAPTRRIATMEQNRAKLIAAARKAFGTKGFAASSMDELTADAGLTLAPHGNLASLVADIAARGNRNRLRREA